VSFEWAKIVKSLNWTLVFNLINFGLLILLLRWLLFKPAIAYLDRRREAIAARMTAAKTAEEHAVQLAATREEELAQARERATRILDDTRQRADEAIEEAKARAKKEADRIIEDARLQMEQERDQKLAELKAAYAEIAVLGAERVLDREIRVEDHRRLLDQLLEGIDEKTLKV
jgi:F-type H+-transporting ATPase subunit b